MIGYHGAPQTTSSVYVCNLPPGTNEGLLADHFGQIGVIKKDKRTNKLKIWIYRDKATNEPKGDATVTYEDPHAAAAAVDWFDNKDFHGNLIRVSIAESKTKDAPEPQLMTEPVSDISLAGEHAAGDEFAPHGDFGSMRPLPPDVGDTPGDIGGAPFAGRGRGRGDMGGKVWQQEGDWPCPNPSCGNINFAFRGSCNRCNASRPSSGSGPGGGGRGRGRGGDSGARGGRGGGIFGPNDWNCPMCGNTNWAKRTKCNICNTTKPGHTEGGAREGRAGGYKELDEAEIEETKRRRKELEEDDGEMYDEFGNLKKKFRLRAKQGENKQPLGSLGWDKEELGFVENEKKKSRSRDRESSRDHNGYRRTDDREDRSRSRSRERERSSRGDDRENDWGRERDRSRDRDRDSRDKERVRSRERERERDRDRDYRERDRVDRRGR